ncbi:MAG: GNAT family N-acetyltransferase [Prevotellaceae bacterium]|nr:GNAT family N-acetyltransferase [Prevotellaceae bacterium]
MVFCIYYQNAFAGLIGFKGTDYVHSKTEIGYWIRQQFQGKGIISKSCKVLVDYAFNEMKINRIQLYIVEANAKSAKVGERLGFKHEGTKRDGEKLVSGFTNVMVFSLLRREYFINIYSRYFFKRDFILRV